MWFLIWVTLVTNVPMEPAAAFRTKSLCVQVAVALNEDKPAWGEYRCKRRRNET